MFAVPWRYKSLRLNEDVLDPNYLQPNLQLRVMDFMQEEEFTQAPQYLLESELIALMDKHGIGQLIVGTFIFEEYEIITSSCLELCFE